MHEVIAPGRLGVTAHVVPVTPCNEPHGSRFRKVGCVADINSPESHCFNWLTARNKETIASTFAPRKSSLTFNRNISGCSYIM